jgi:hypothetical protein
MRGKASLANLPTAAEIIAFLAQAEAGLKQMFIHPRQTLGYGFRTIPLVEVLA